MSPTSNPALLLKLPAWRARLLLLLVLCWFIALAARAFYLQGLRNDFLQQKGASRYTRVIALNANRGMITDRYGEPLAISTPVESVWVSPSDIKISEGQKNKLARLLDMKTPELEKRLSETNKDFTYLKRQLPPDHAAKIVELGISGLFLQREYRRYYPAGEVTAHLLGFTDINDKGQEGLELTYQEVLAGKPGSRTVIKDRVGHIIEDIKSIRSPQQGQDLALSIDQRIQYIAYRELKNAVTANRAKAGGVVVLDAKTGEVLALANVPVYNPNNREKMTAARMRNRVITDLFEPGSTLKPFTVAAALDAGLLNADTLIQTAPGYLTVGRATIHDAHPQGALTISQVIQKSSNVGAAMVALKLAPSSLWNILHNVGFGSAPRSGFPGESTGKLRAYQSWRPIEQATMSYGHGISVSLLQLARAYTIFASDGQLKPISLVKLDEVPQGKEVISPQSARAVRSMLETVVEPGGTAPRARIPGYRVAGKTGTAHKPEGNGYAAHRYVSSFVGFAPASNPRVIVAVMIDEPSAGQYYGGTVAAPAFAQIMSGTLRTLGITPDAPTESIMIAPVNVPEIKEEV